MQLEIEGRGPSAGPPGDSAELIRWVWHELNTPVTALSLCIQAAVRQTRGIESAAALHKRLTSAQWQCQILAQMLSRLRNSVETPGTHLAPEPLDLRDLVERATTGLEDLFESAGIPLHVQCDSVPGHWDAVALVEIIDNLLSNAVRYGAGSDVTVRLKNGGDHGLLLVHDGGPGVPLIDRERIFDRGHRGSTAQGPGLGLGLALVRELVEAHGGRVQLLDGPGASFQVQLPIREAAQVSGGAQWLAKS